MRIKLRRLDNWIEARRERAAWYRDLLGSEARLPVEPAAATHVYHLFVTQVDDRASFRTAMAEQGVQTAVHYPEAVHLIKGFQDAVQRGGQLVVAEAAAARVVSLPMFPELTRDEVETVARAVAQVMRQTASASGSLNKLALAANSAGGSQSEGAKTQAPARN